jgi:hypothetical protein
MGICYEPNKHEENGRQYTTEVWRFYDIQYHRICLIFTRSIMYKKVIHDDGKIELQEHFNSPMVYLDHWALNDFALDGALRKRFIELMNKKAGTFRLSLVNIAELNRQANKSQVDAILQMIDSITDCGFINVDHGEVIKKENILIANPSMISAVQNPSAEIEIVELYLMAKNYPDTWHVSDVIRAALNESLSNETRKNNIDFMNKVKPLIEQGRYDKQLLEKTKKIFLKLKARGPRYQAATRELADMAINFVLKNITMKMAEYSEWQDIFHVIVPVSYCDLVLIDCRWKTFISQTGFVYPQIAKVFDKSAMDDFFQTVENWNTN